MDGGGRFLRPLSAGSTGGAAVAAPTSVRPCSPDLRRSRPRVWRRASVITPLQRRLPPFLGTGLVLVFFALVGLTGAVVGGHYQRVLDKYGEPRHMLARTLGLGLERVTISGIGQLTEAEILGIAGISTKASLPFLDVAEIRDRLERVPLIRNASVRKLYPGELLITMSEREPHALWQHNGEVFLIAVDGTVIDIVQDARFSHLPLVVGDLANGRSGEYLALLEAAGPLKSRIVAGMLVSGRRWTLKIDNGMDVRLPEQGAAAAVARLVKLEREQRIFDKDIISLDLRMSDRVVVRLTEEAMAARLDAAKKKPPRGKGVET
ncbi:MAG TPA: cell division protein FtsQ/DivIB [Beijerinckiaceae bacterium]|jgi:cell division protein FtsQ